MGDAKRETCWVVEGIMTLAVSPVTILIRIALESGELLSIREMENTLAGSAR